MRGSVRRRGSTYTWYISVPDPVTGERRQRSKGGFRTKRECQEALNEALARLREGTFVRSSPRSLGAFLIDEWLPAVRPPRVRPSTWASYRMAVERHIVPALGGVLLQGLTPAHLTAFHRALLDGGRRDGHGGLASKSVRNIHGVLHAALRDAVRWGYLPRNIASLADLPKGMAPEMRVWSPEQLRTFLDQVRGDPLHAAWMLFATTGMRRGEVAGLRWPDVDLEAGRVSPQRPRVVVNNEVVVSEPKTAKGRRSLALDPATIAALREHRTRQLEQRLAVGPRWQDSGLVFTWPEGRPIHPERFSRWFEQHARDAGLPKIRLHDVRHSYATAALAAGVPAKVVSERLGHATIAITMDTYSHVLPGLDAQAADTVARLILGDFDQEPTRPVDKALTTGRKAPGRGEEVKGERPGRRGVRAGGFEPPRVAPPGPKPGASAVPPRSRAAVELTTAGSGALFRSGGGWALLDGPGVAVGVAEEDEGVPAAAGTVDAGGALVVLDLADGDAPLGQPGAGGLDVGDDELQALHRPRRRLDHPGGDGDRAGRPGRGQLHDVDIVADPGVVVDGEAHLLAVEALCPIHVGDGNDHQLQLPVHVHPLAPSLPGDPGSSYRGDQKAVTWSPGPASGRRPPTSGHADYCAGVLAGRCPVLSVPSAGMWPRCAPRSSGISRLVLLLLLVLAGRTVGVRGGRPC
jgi:integrase